MDKLRFHIGWHRCNVGHRIGHAAREGHSVWSCLDDVMPSKDWNGVFVYSLIKLGCWARRMTDWTQYWWSVLLQ